MSLVIPNFGNVSEKTWDLFYKWAQDEQTADRVRANSYLERVKAQDKGIGEKSVDGLGECFANMDSRIYHRQLQNDKKFWSDEGNIKRFFKDNPQYLNTTKSGSTYKI
jgi:hypothetical protein